MIIERSQVDLAFTIIILQLLISGTSPSEVGMDPTDALRTQISGQTATYDGQRLVFADQSYDSAEELMVRLNEQQVHQLVVTIDDDVSFYSFSNILTAANQAKIRIFVAKK